MTSRELLYVKTAAETGNISRAAKKLFVAQPSLSQSLQKIEDNLGTRLFIRGSDGLRLTYAGEKYYQMACHILRTYEDFETEIREINDLRRGHISFGVTNHLGSIILPKILPAFKKKYPGITLDIFEGATEPQEKKLIAGDLDFAIMHAPVQDQSINPSLSYEILAEHPFLVALDPKNPLCQMAKEQEGYPYPVLDIRLLKDLPLLTLHKEQRIRQITDAVMKKANIHPEIQLVSQNYRTLEALAAEGIGFTLLPMDYALSSKMPNDPVFFSIEKKYHAQWELCIASLKDGFTSNAAGQFLSILRDAYLP